MNTKHKVVINKCYGGFGLSNEAKRLLAHKLNLAWDKVVSRYMYPCDGNRHCPALIEVVQQLQHKANTRNSNLQILTIPSNRYRIREYDGWETLVTPETEQSWVTITTPPVPDAKPDAKPDPFGVVMELLSGAIPMPKGEIAYDMISDAIDDELYDPED